MPVPPLKQVEIDRALLQSAVDAAGVRLYTDEQIDAYTIEERATVVYAEKSRVLRIAFEEENTRRPRTENGIQILPLSNQKIAIKVAQLLSDEDASEPPELSEEAGGEALPEDVNFPIPPPLEESVPPSSAQEGLAADVKKQLEKPVIPPLVPVGSLTELAVFIEPITRNVFVLIVANPTGFFYIGINVPCGWPIVIPPFYPVTLVGPPPAGAFVLPFMDLEAPYCTGSSPADLEALSVELGVISELKTDPDIVPCDKNLDYPEMAACVQALNKQMQAKLAPMELTPALKKLLDQIAAAANVPGPEITPPERSTEEEIEILIEDGISGLFEGINIIE